MAEVPSKGTSSLDVDPEPVHVSSKGDEGSKVPLLSRSHRTKGPTVVMAEALPGEVTKRQTTRGDSLSASVPTKTVASSSFPSQRMNVDPIDIQQGPSIELMSLVEIPEQSATTGFVGVELPTTGLLPTPVSSWASSEKLD